MKEKNFLVYFVHVCVVYFFGTPTWAYILSWRWISTILKTNSQFCGTKQNQNNNNNKKKQKNKTIKKVNKNESTFCLCSVCFFSSSFDRISTRFLCTSIWVELLFIISNTNIWFVFVERQDLELSLISLTYISPLMNSIRFLTWVIASCFSCFTRIGPTNL